MPLNAGDAEYGSMPGNGLTGNVDSSETTPLLMPEPQPEPPQPWRPLSKGELQAVAGGPGWRKARCYLVLLFWLSWLAILSTAVAIIIYSPRPVVPQMQWWQRAPFYQVPPQLFLQTDSLQPNFSVLLEQLPHLKSLGIGALILQGLFNKEMSPLNLSEFSKNVGMLTQIQHLITESNKANLKVVLDFCNLDLMGSQHGEEAAEQSLNISLTMQHAVRLWMEEDVAGFVICDTDEAYSEKTLLEWRSVLKEFSSAGEERIVVVKQTREFLPLPSNSDNVTLVDMVMRSILPHSDHLLSGGQVAEAIENHLQTQDQTTWLSWTVGGKASYNLKKLLLVLTMTLPGSPTVQWDEEIHQAQNTSVRVDSLHSEVDEPADTHTDKEDTRHSTIALFTSLSHARAREEALLYGNFTFLPFNSSSFSASLNSTFSSPSSTPILAFLRSWGCVHFLILLNVGPEPHVLDPAWAPNLPEAGVFLSSTGMDRLGSTSLYTLSVQPHEAIVIKLFQGGSYS